MPDERVKTVAAHDERPLLARYDHIALTTIEPAKQIQNPNPTHPVARKLL